MRLLGPIKIEVARIVQPSGWDTGFPAIMASMESCWLPDFFLKTTNRLPHPSIFELL